jgi:hypothetical protein
MDSVWCRYGLDSHSSVSAPPSHKSVSRHREKESLTIFKLRSASQTRKLGIRKLRTDDWVMVTVIPWYTLLVVSINKIIFGGGSNYMTPEDIAALTPQTKADRISGSKWVLVSEEAMVLCVWTCKICMLLIYRRLT